MTISRKYSKSGITTWLKSYFQIIFSCCCPAIWPIVFTKGKPRSQPTWFHGGPTLSFVPLPIPDSERGLGAACNSCKDKCNKHYLAPERQYEHFMKHGLVYSVQPPSKIFKEFVKTQANLSEKDIDDLAKKCLLDISDMKMWVQN